MLPLERGKILFSDDHDGVLFCAIDDDRKRLAAMHVDAKRTYFDKRDFFAVGCRNLLLRRRGETTIASFEPADRPEGSHASNGHLLSRLFACVRASALRVADRSRLLLALEGTL